MVLQTPVTSIIVTRNRMILRPAMIAVVKGRVREKRRGELELELNKAETLIV